jgi:hypothetical protein
MRFEDAIKAMRDGKRCRRDGNTATYHLQNNRLCYTDGGESTLNLPGALAYEWHIVEPPLPLPRRFRAKWLGSPVVGCELSDGYCSWNGGDSDPGARAWPSQHEKLTDIEYIDPPCTS